MANNGSKSSQAFIVINAQYRDGNRWKPIQVRIPIHQFRIFIQKALNSE